MYVGCTVQQGSYTTMMLSVEKGTACDRVLLFVVARQVNHEVNPVDECAVSRVPTEEAERRDGGAIAWHAAPADWPAAKRRYASGEDSGERRTAHVSVHMIS